MKDPSNSEKEYLERHLRQDLAAKLGEDEESDGVNQPQNPGSYHFTQEHNYPISSRKR
jgi:hypothetical protein